MNIYNKVSKERTLKDIPVVRPSSHIGFEANDGSEIESKKNIVTATCCSRALFSFVHIVVADNGAVSCCKGFSNKSDE